MTSLLIFVAMVIVTLAGSVGLLSAIYAKRWQRARALTVGIGAICSTYLLLVAIVDISSPQIGIHRGEPLCFDDFCYTVTDVERATRLKTPNRLVSAKGAFIVISVRVTNQGRGRPQAAPFARMRVWRENTYYDVSSDGVAAARTLGRPVVAAATRIEAGQSYVTTAVFDLPANGSAEGLVIDHGLTPDAIIIGATDWFHGPRILRLR